jgi:hypothetical protein
MWLSAMICSDLPELQALNNLRASLGYYQQFPIPTITEDSTECEKIWRDTLVEKRIAYNSLFAQQPVGDQGR